MNQLVKQRDAAAAGVRRIRIPSAGATTSGVVNITVGDLIGSIPLQSKAAIENAVYAHVQAMRALGHTTVHTGDIARSLGLPQSAVDATIAALTKKGVKVA